MSSSDDEYEPSVDYSDISDSDDSEYESEVESDDNDPVFTKTHWIRKKLNQTIGKWEVNIIDPIPYL